jgi:hypothetical protein
LALTVAATTALTTGTSGTIGIAAAGLRRLLDALVGKAVANVGFAVFAGATATIGTVLALRGWILTNAILANEAFSTVAFGGAVRIRRLAAAVHAILTGGASGRIAATHFAKACFGAVGIRRTVGIFKAFKLAHADAFVQIGVRAIADARTRNIAAVVRNLVGRDGSSLITGQNTHEKNA